MKSLKQRHNWFFSSICQNQFEKPQFAKSCDFKSFISKAKGGWGRRVTSTWLFGGIFY